MVFTKFKDCLLIKKRQKKNYFVTSILTKLSLLMENDDKLDHR